MRISITDKIRVAGAKVFAEQGYLGGTIAQIAKEADISEASIYEHFNTKEALFLTIATEKLTELLPIIEDHLFGIKGAMNQLRKFIWVYVRHMMENQTHARLALLHLKTSKSFLETEAYKEVQKFYGKITEIIKLGQKTGEIRPDINPYSARTLCLGSVEHLMIRWFLKDCSYDPLVYLEEIYNLIEEALKARPTVQENLPVNKTIDNPSKGGMET
jgi:TetR/AcrR family fatty acid metabolism transcriptional regulator